MFLLLKYQFNSMSVFMQYIIKDVIKAKSRKPFVNQTAG